MSTDDACWAALAACAGRHGLALYAGMLGALLLAASLTGRRLASQRAGPGRQALGPIAMRGLALASVPAGLFAIIAWQLGADDALGAADAEFLQALGAQVSPAVHRLFAGLTHAADTATLTSLALAGAVALWAQRQPQLAGGWVLAIAGNAVLNTSLKAAFGRLRPEPLADALAAPGLSFPSGHSSGAVVAYGMAAYLACRLLPPRWQVPTLLLAVALAFSIGASRLILRAHYPSDVLAGFASGSAWLALCITGLALARAAGWGQPDAAHTPQ